MKPISQLCLRTTVQKGEILLLDQCIYYVHLPLLWLSELCMGVHFIWHILCTRLWQCSVDTPHSTLYTVQCTPNTVHSGIPLFTLRSVILCKCTIMHLITHFTIATSSERKETEKNATSILLLLHFLFLLVFSSNVK